MFTQKLPVGGDIYPDTGGPLRLATRLVAFGFMRGTFALLPPPGMVVDQRHLSRLAGHRTDDLAAIGGVSQIVKVGDPLTGQAHQRDRRLAIME